MASRARSWTARITFIALIISLVPLSAFSAQKVTAGAMCKTLNSKAIANNKTYTCIKSGKKLVWNKGVPIKIAAPTPKVSPSAMPSLTPKEVDDLSRDSRISNVSLLSNVSICKTTDNTPDFTSAGNVARNGFPRPKEAMYPTGKAKVLVIPFNYKTWNFTTAVPQGSNRTVADIDLLKVMIKNLEKFVKESSGGRFEVSITVLPEKEWWTMDPETTFSYGPMVDNFGPFLKMIEKNDGKIDFTEFDSYMFIAGTTYADTSIAQAVYSSNLKTSKGQANKLVAITTGWQNYPLVFHELGHSLFGFEDLYLFGDSPAEWLPKELKVALRWEIMADSNSTLMTNWNRLLMGWIPDEEIRCLTDQTDSVHYLSGVPSKNEPKILLINLVPGVTLIGESRNIGDSQGLLLYIVDTNLGHGRGPMRALDNLIRSGETKELFDWKFEVLKSSKDGLLLKVSKGTGTKYVAPARQEINQGGGADDRPRPRVGEVLPTTYLNAQVRWEITNYKSYRIFITPYDDPKKILFDTGIVNDSRDPLIVEVSGLICGKELVTTSQFWTERDGKGVKEQSSSGQLGKFECK